MKLKELLPKGIYSLKPKKDNDSYYDNLMDYILDNTDLEDLVSLWEGIENHPAFKNIPKFYKDECVGCGEDNKHYYIETSNLTEQSNTGGNWYE